MPADLSTIDLATLNTAQGVIVAALRNKCCQWEQESSDAARDGRLSNALMLEHWAFAADLLAHQVVNDCAALFCRTLDARINWSTIARLVEDQVLNALSVEVASAR